MNESELKRADKQADDIILQTATGLAVSGAVNPIPLVGDPIFIVSGWATMLARLAKCYDIPFDENAFRVTIRQVFKSVGFYYTGTLLFMTIVKWTGFGTIASSAANATLNSAFTYVVGRAYKNAWREGLDVNPNDIVNGFKGALGK